MFTGLATAAPKSPWASMPSTLYHVRYGVQTSVKATVPLYVLKCRGARPVGLGAIIRHLAAAPTTNGGALWWLLAALPALVGAALQ